jgi:type IV secretory pathway TraG/TraD family ATPase VirD4
MDEYHTVASDLPQMGIGDNFFISQARQFGCFTMLVTQNLAQLRTSQLGENWEAAFSNMLAKIFFSVGDPDTARFASDLAGDREESDEAFALGSEAGGGSSLTRTLSRVERPLIPARTFTSGLRQGRVILIGSVDGGISRAPLEILRIPR